MTKLMRHIAAGLLVLFSAFVLFGVHLTFSATHDSGMHGAASHHAAGHDAPAPRCPLSPNGDLCIFSLMHIEHFQQLLTAIMFFAVFIFVGVLSAWRTLWKQLQALFIDLIEVRHHVFHEAAYAFVRDPTLRLLTRMHPRLCA